MPNPWGSWARLTEPWYRWPFSRIRELFLQNMHFHCKQEDDIKCRRLSPVFGALFTCLEDFFYLRLQMYWPAAESFCWLVLFFPSLTFTFCKNSQFKSLKVDGNEKLGASGRIRVMELYSGIVATKFICNLNVQFPCKQSISISACYNKINRRCLDEQAKRGQ